LLNSFASSDHVLLELFLIELAGYSNDLTYPCRWARGYLSSFYAPMMPTPLCLPIYFGLSGGGVVIDAFVHNPSHKRKNEREKERERKKERERERERKNERERERGRERERDREREREKE
jgi:hypothetical protein